MGSSVKKWLIWVGAFLVLVGFFIPTPTIYFAPFHLDAAQSINGIALNGQGILYLVLVGILLAAAVAFFSPRSNLQKVFVALGEGAGLVLGITALLLIAAAVFQFFGAINTALLSYTFEVTLALFVLLLGYSLAGFGVIMELFEAAFQSSPATGEETQHDYETAVANPFPPLGDADATALDSPTPVVLERMPRLELVKGNAPAMTMIGNEDFHIGRSSQNHLAVNDPQVSRLHVRIRGAQGAWFIQDQNSAGGTFVNDHKVQAQRLQNGDQIRIGQTVFRFHV